MTTQALNLSPVTIIIPARLGSTRFPAKVLADATGKPLIRHVWESASKSRRAGAVVIATDDDRVRAACDGFGARCVMTSALHPNGTSRLSEAARVLQLPDGHIVVNVQGDEPELDAGLIDGAVEAMERTHAEVGTVVSPFGPEQNVSDPNIVKCVMRADGTAVYFSRAAIPFDRDGGGTVYHRHVGIYAYTAGFLHRYAALHSTPLENAEKLEQLRVLEHGYRVGVAVMDSSHEGIDTPEQYARFVARWKAGNEKPRR